MRLLRRLLLLLVLGSYLLSRYGFFLRENLWYAYSAQKREFQYRPPMIATNQSQSVHADLPPGVLPRHELTPGAIDPRVTQSNIGSTICRRGYTKSVRPPFEYTNAMKHRLMRLYGVSGSIHDYELDHLIPLELGGCSDCEANLWPEARNVFPGASEKDEVEEYLRSAPSARLRSVISITEPGPPAQEPSGRCTGIIQGAELPKLHPVRPVKNSRALTSLGFPEWGGMKQASTGEQTARRTASVPSTG